jgi:hypothetical protein
MKLQEIYEEKCSIPSDINEHLPTLKKYAEECEHVTEMGVRWVVSTYALLMGKPKKMISYDINPVNWEWIKDLVKEHTDFEFKVGDTTKIEIEETDLLFIDTWHVYDQLKIELEIHSNKAKKYIIMHDTTLFEYIGETIEGELVYQGLWPAIEEFLEDNNEWQLLERYENNNGLTILKRK